MNRGGMRTRAKRWTSPVRFSPCGSDKSVGSPMTTCATAPSRCSRQLKSPTGNDHRTVLPTRSRPRELLKFLRALETRVPGVHLVMDNYTIHKPPAVQRWLARPSALVFPLHPDRRLLAQPSRALLRRVDREIDPARGPSVDTGTRTGHSELHRHRHTDPRPFRLTKSAVYILATIKRFYPHTLDTAERRREIIKTSEPDTTKFPRTQGQHSRI